MSFFNNNHYKQKNCFHILGVNENSNDNDIKYAYLKLVKLYHPDINKDENAIEKFKEISYAYEILKNNNSRLKYIDRLHNNNYSQYQHSSSSSSSSHDFYDDIRKKDKSRFDTIFSKFWKQNNNKNRIFNVILPCFITASLLYSFIYYMNKSSNNKIGDKSTSSSISSTATTTTNKNIHNSKIKFYADNDHDDITTTSTTTTTATNTPPTSYLNTPSSTTIIKKKDDYVMAWYNPRNSRWETPAPWDKDYQRSIILKPQQYIRKDLVFDSSNTFTNDINK